MSYSAADLVRDLRRLVRLEEIEPRDLDHWHAEAAKVQASIRAEPTLANCIEREIWIYLSDADIRARKGYEGFGSSQALAAIEAAEALADARSRGA